MSADAYPYRGDLYAGWSFVLGNAQDPTYLPLRGPDFEPIEDRRRLRLGEILDAYYNNSGRHFLSGPGIDARAKAERREYGTAGLIRDTIGEGVMGDSLAILIPGAVSAPPEQPELPPLPEPPPDGATPAALRAYGIALAEASDAQEAAVDEWIADKAKHKVAVKVDKVVQAWKTDEAWESKTRYGEIVNSLGFGDGVYTLLWSHGRKRAVYTVEDPHSYFPILNDDGFPARLHFASQLDKPDGDTSDPEIRITTFELRKLPAARKNKWDGRPMTHSCYMTDGIYKLRGPIDISLAPKSTNVKSFTPVEDDDGPIVDRDLDQDFMPVYKTIGLPGNMGPDYHFGLPVITPVAQAIPDEAGVFTDMLKSSRLSGWPVVAVGGSPPEIKDSTGRVIGYQTDVDVEPGRFYWLGEAKTINVMDLSAGLRAIGEHYQTIMRPIINRAARVPSELQGQEDGPDVAVSGKAIRLKFGPYVAMCRALRQSRERPLNLMLKHLVRLNRIHGVLEKGPDVFPEIQFGSVLPSEQDTVVEWLAELRQQGFVSLDTALERLKAAGILPDIDVKEEAERIRREDLSGAADLAQALGSRRAAAKILGIDPDAFGITDEPPPAPQPPAVPQPPKQPPPAE